MTVDVHYTVQEVSEILRVSTTTVRRWLADNRIRGIKLSNQAGWRIPRSELDQLLRILS